MFKHLRLKRPLTVIDIESTGVNPPTDRVVEIACLRVAADAKPVWAVRRVNPTVPIPPAATAVHGIRDQDVKDCPTFADIARKVARFVADSDLAGFGIKRFDLPLLVAEFRRAGVHFPLAGRRVLDAMQIFHARERRDLNTAVAFYCGRRHDSPHRADHDVLAAAHVLEAQLGRYADLPRTVAGLHTVLAEADLTGRFRVIDGEPVFGFGKYAGRRLKDVARDDPRYLEWILAGDFLDDVKELARTALKNASAQV